MGSVGIRVAVGQALISPASRRTLLQCTSSSVPDQHVSSRSSSSVQRQSLAMAAASNSSIGKSTNIDMISSRRIAATSKNSIVTKSGNLILMSGDGNLGLASVVKLRAYASSSKAGAEAGVASSTNDGEKKGRVGVFAGGVAIVSAIFQGCKSAVCCGVQSKLRCQALWWRTCHRPFVHKPEADIDLAAEFVEAGATLVIKVAQEVEAIAHVAELSATEAEALAIKVDATTKLVKKRLDEIADLLEGEKNVSTILADYVARKKDAETVTEQHQDSQPKEKLKQPSTDSSKNL